MTDDTINRIELTTDVFTFDFNFKIYRTTFSLIGKPLEISSDTEIYLINPRLEMFNRLYKFDSYYEGEKPAFVFIPDNYDTMLVIFED